jgi:hypothetical protein
VVDPADITEARFLTYALLGADYDNSPYTQTGDRVARVAVSGIRLVIEEFRSAVTKTRKDGSRANCASTTATRANPANRSPG